MKKFFLFSVLAFVCAMMTSGQMTDADIIKIIQKSREYNQQVVDPNLIFPGQVITFEFLDGAIYSIEVEEGDTQWFIIRDKLSKLEEKHGPVVDPTPVQPEKPVVIEETEDEASETEKGWPWWAWVLIAFGIASVGVFLWLLTRNKSIFQGFRKRDVVKFSENPAKEGKPFVEGGIEPENATEHFRTLARRNHPHSQIIIKDVKPVFISTPGGLSAVVEFADNTKGNFAFVNQPGHSGLVSINGGKTFHRELYFDACGNPVYMRRSMKEQDNLIVTERPIKFGYETEVSPEKQAVTEEKIEKVEKEKSDLTSKISSDSDEVMIVHDHATVADEFLKTQRAHKVTMEYTKNADGSVSIKSVFETKNEPAVKSDTEKTN